MTSSNEAQIHESAQSGRTDLGQEYRKIGISAIAAALPYVGEQKNKAYAPTKVLTLRDLELLVG